MSDDIAWKCYLADQTEKWNKISAEEKNAYERKYNYEHLDEVAECFGGVLKAYLDCSDSDRNNLPPKLYQLVNYINRYQVPPDDLIKYAASPALWIGMTMTPEDIEYACNHGLFGYIKWLNKRYDDQFNYSNVFELAVIYNQPKIIEWAEAIFDLHEYAKFADTRDFTIATYCSGHVNMIEFLFAKGLDTYLLNMDLKYVFCENCVDNNLEMVQWIIDHNKLKLSQDEIDNYFTGGGEENEEDNWYPTPELSRLIAANFKVSPAVLKSHQHLLTNSN